MRNSDGLALIIGSSTKISFFALMKINIQYDFLKVKMRHNASNMRRNGGLPLILDSKQKCLKYDFCLKGSYFFQYDFNLSKNA